CIELLLRFSFYQFVQGPVNRGNPDFSTILRSSPVLSSYYLNCLKFVKNLLQFAVKTASFRSGGEPPRRPYGPVLQNIFGRPLPILGIYNRMKNRYFVPQPVWGRVGTGEET
ncbi:hypothetical protein LI291_16405, partial [Intestinibacillus massiliensis]|nr:hypothetical protein [Intestinibacillus massiliensis]